MKEKHLVPTASSRITEDTIIIEEVETDIKELAKKAVSNATSRDDFLKNAFELIKKKLARVRSPTIRSRAIEAFPTFALTVYNEQLKLMAIYAGLYQLGERAIVENIPGSEDVYEQILNVLGSVKETVFFRKIIAVKPIDSPIGTGIVVNGEELTVGVFNYAVPLGEQYDKYMEAVRSQKRTLIMMDAQDRYDGNVSLRNIAEMTVRYEHQLNMISDLKEKGENLAYIEPHANCSPRCAKYQVGGSKHKSGLYSLDDTEGVTPEGIPYKPLSFATDNPDDVYVTKAGKVYQNGCVTGFGCRHRLIPYRKGNKPMPIPKQVIEAQYKAETKQREMERDIREARGALIQANTVEEKKEYNALVKRLQAKYEKFSRDHELAFYPQRTKIF